MSFQRIRRRGFIAGLGGAAAWPLVARAQGKRMWRIGVLMTTAADDPEGQSRIAALMQGLQQSGLSIGGNVQIDVRFGVDQAKLRKHAGELATTSDVIVAAGSAATGPLLQTTRTVPIVFAMVADPVGAGFVESLARPGGNATGFTNFEYDISGKWLALLKELAPAVTRAAVIRDPTLALGAGQFGSIQAVAPSLRVEVIPVNVGDDTGGMERAIAAFVRSPNGGLIVTGSALVTLHRKLIIALAAQHRLPAIYPTRFYASDGGLVSYGPTFLDQFRRAGNYIDRILKGDKPADLPVQAPTKYELVVNLRTAKELGLDVPPSLLARADEVIE